MRRFRILGVLILAASCTFALAQTVAVRGSGGWSASAPFNMLYNQNSVVVFDGKVIGIERSAPMPGMEVSVAALVKSKNGGTSTVDLGPAWFVDNQSVKVQVGDTISVTGSKVFRDGRSLILAQKIVAKNTVTYLRGMDGFPMWVAWKGHVTVGANSNSGTTIDPNASVIDTGGVSLVTGTVRDIIEVPIGGAGTPSVILVVSNNDNSYSNVYLGPSWYINRQDMFFNVGDQLVIRGEVNGEHRLNDDPLIRAINVRRGSQIMSLRNRAGGPVWLNGGR